MARSGPCSNRATEARSRTTVRLRYSGRPLPGELRSERLQDDHGTHATGAGLIRVSFPARPRGADGIANRVSAVWASLTGVFGRARWTSVVRSKMDLLSKEGRVPLVACGPLGTTMYQEDCHGPKTHSFTSRDAQAIRDSHDHPRHQTEPRLFPDAPRDRGLPGHQQEWCWAAVVRKVTIESNSRKRACSGSIGGGGVSPGSFWLISGIISAMSAAPGPISSRSTSASCC